MNHFIFSAFVVCVTALAASLYLIFQRPPRIVNQFFGLFWLAVAFWTYFVAMQAEFLRWIPGRLWGWLLHLGCISVPVLFFHFALHLSACRKQYSWALKTVYGTALVFILLNVFTHLFTGAIIYRDDYAYPKPAVLYPLYIAFFQMMGLWTFILVLQAGQLIPTKFRKLLYFYLALHVFAYLGSMDNFLIMYDIRMFPLYPYGVYLILPSVVFGTYVISKIQISGFNFGKS